MSAVTVKHASERQSDPHSGVFSPPCGPGDVIEGKYRIERLIGSGGMAWVFETTHLVLQHRVALKVLRIDTGADNTEALARFEREARAAAAVSGEATARVMDTGTLDDGSPFLVMELLEGRDLDSVVQAKPRLPVVTAVNYVLQACEGVAETHAAGVVHRDLKPSNLFITQASDGSVRVKLLDFGISKITRPSADARVTATRGLVGSPVYMSPEQMRASRTIDGRTDIWSLGVILFELLAGGSSPFEAPTLPAICALVLDSPPPPLRKMRREVPRALEAVVLRCLQKDPDRRYPTVADLAQALVPFGPADAAARARRVRRILEGSGIVTRAPASRRHPRSPLAGALAAAAVLVLSGIAVQHPRYVQSAGVAGRAWSHWTRHVAQATSATVREDLSLAPAPSTTAQAEPPLLETPVVSSAAPLPAPAAVTAALEPSPVAASPEPLASEQKASARSGAVAPRTLSTLDAASPASIEELLAEARGDVPPTETATAKSTRTRGSHRSRFGKHYVTEQIPSPDPAPPIVVPAPAPASTSTSSADPDSNPYQETFAVPDLGGRE